LEKLFDRELIEAKLIEFLAWIQDDIFVLSAIIQFAVIITAFLIANVTATRFRSWLEREWNLPWYEQYCKIVARALAPLSLPVIWLALQWFSVFAAENAGWSSHLIEIVVSLLTAWVIIRLAATLIRNPQLARIITLAAWTIAALNITGLLEPTMAVLDSMAMNVGHIHISVLSIIKAIIALVALLWLAGAISGLVERRMNAMPGVTPAAGVLFGKIFRILVFTIAVVVGLESVGIDLTAFAVFSGAVGFGIGFGLQKVFSNLISGMILLMDRSVKPGDVIAVGDSFGWINALRARYVSVITRDGTEHLIPNEELISQRVENWSHSHQLVRQRMAIGIDYEADVNRAMELALEAASGVDRILTEPAPACRLVGFGDNSIDLDLRVWINDPQNGVANIRSEILLGVWNLYRDNGINFPFPQRDLHIRSTVPFRVESVPAE